MMGIDPDVLRRVRAAVSTACDVRNDFESEIGHEGSDADVDDPLYTALDGLIMPVLVLLGELPDPDSETSYRPFGGEDRRGD